MNMKMYVAPRYEGQQGQHEYGLHAGIVYHRITSSGEVRWEYTAVNDEAKSDFWNAPPGGHAWTPCDEPDCLDGGE